MLTPRISVRLMSFEELAVSPHPDACVEVAFGPMRPANDPNTVVYSEPLRMRAVDLVQLHVEADLALGQLRAEVLRAEIAWKQQLGRWYEEGRQAVETGLPDVALLQRVLDALKKLDPVAT
ncbi:MAG: hypothetical protein JO362_19800 [Streptomycetaceae bacterium]|nr:hypothetical protein [Streptomycetaceae bacterium]